MSQQITNYLAQIELAFVSTPIIATYQVVRSWANNDDGYLRLRATLTNGDFLEAAEYFVWQEGQFITVDYRHQWMDSSKQKLHRRWDNTPDHPQIANFPYHVHVDTEQNVMPSQPISLLELLALLEQLGQF